MTVFKVKIFSQWMRVKISSRMVSLDLFKGANKYGLLEDVNS